MTDRHIQNLVNAWTDPGIRPDVHERAKRKLWAEWPMLAAAVTDVVNQSRRQTKLDEIRAIVNRMRAGSEEYYWQELEEILNRS